MPAVLSSAGPIAGGRLQPISKGRSGCHRARWLISLASFAAAGLTLPHFAAAQTPSFTWTNSLGNDLWNQDSNWSTTPENANTFPGQFNPGADVEIPAGLGSAELNTNALIDNLIVDSSAEVVVLPGKTLLMNGANTDINNGTILLNPTGANSTTNLFFDDAGTDTLSGTGIVYLNDDGGGTNLGKNAEVTTADNCTLIIDTHQIILGRGGVNGLITNNGLIQSSEGTLWVNGSITNNQYIAASPESEISIQGIVTQGSAGQIVANAGFVSVAGTLIGGSIQSVNSGSVELQGGTISNSTISTLYVQSGTISGGTISSGATVAVLDNSLLYVAAPTLINNGTITLNPYQIQLATSTLEFAGGGSVLLSGSGTIVLSGITGGVGTFSQLVDDGSTSAIVDTHQTIAGFGLLNTTLTNNGTLLANVNAGTLFLGGNITNNNVIQASNGGILSVIGSLTDNGTVVFAGGKYFGSTINRFNVLNGGTMILAGSPTILITGSILTNNGIGSLTAPTFSGGPSAILTGAGTMVSSGTLTVLAGTTLTIDAQQTLSASGTFIGNFVNNGTILDATGTSLSIPGPVVNNNVILASGTAATTSISGSLTGNGVIEALNGGSVGILGTVSGMFETDSKSAIYGQGGTLSNCTIEPGSHFVVQTGSIINVIGSALSNNGTAALNGTADFDSGAPILLTGNGTTAIAGLLTTSPSTTLTIDSTQFILGTGTISGNVINNGSISAQGGNLYIPSTLLNQAWLGASNSGTLFLPATMSPTLTQGTYEADSKGTIDIAGGAASITTNAANVIINQTNAHFPALAKGLNSNTGQFSILNAGTFATAGSLTNSGSLYTDDSTVLTVNGALNQNAGVSTIWGSVVATAVTTLNGGSIDMHGNGKLTDPAGVLIQSGELIGEGKVVGNVTNAGGTVTPSILYNTFQIAGNLTEEAAGAVDVELGDQELEYGSYIVPFSITGNFALDGAFNLIVDSQFDTPVDPGDTFVLINAGSITGQFATITATDDWTVTVTPTEIYATYVPEPTSAAFAAATLLCASRRIGRRQI